MLPDQHDKDLIYTAEQVYRDLLSTNEDDLPGAHR